MEGIEWYEEDLDIQHLTQMLRVVFDVSWWDHMVNNQLYGDIPKETDEITSRRLQLVGHFRHPELLLEHHLPLWKFKHGKRNRGRPAATYVTTLAERYRSCGWGADKTRWRCIFRARVSDKKRDTYIKKSFYCTVTGKKKQNGKEKTWFINVI